MKLSLIKQIFNVDKYILAISPSKLIIIGFYEVMKCYSETPPLPCFSSFVNDENSIIFLTPSPPIVPFSPNLQFFFWMSSLRYLLIMNMLHIKYEIMVFNHS